MRLSRNLLISSFESTNRSRQVSGTTDASETRLGLISFCTPRRLPHADYVLHRVGCSEEDDQLLREGRQRRHSRRRYDSRHTLWPGPLDENTAAAVDSGDGATVFTGWIHDHLLPHAAALKVAHPLMLRAIAAAKNQKEVGTRAPPKRAGGALALLTKTYHGSRITGQVVSTRQRSVYSLSAPSSC